MEKLNLRIFRCVVEKDDMEKAKEYFDKMEARNKAEIVEIVEGEKRYKIKFKCNIEEFDKVYQGLYNYI